MKKREWDKDLQNVKAWAVKNKAPLLILGCLILIPITCWVISLIIKWYSYLSVLFSETKTIENKFDFTTPALYYFSSIAQTMGAIIGLALAAMYAIMPNIRSSKDNPAFEPARRLLQRDEYFRRSINVGSVCILVSLLGLLFIYVTASSQSWAFVLLLLLGLTALGLGVYSLWVMFYFIRERMPKYFSPVEILELAYKNFQDEIRIKRVDDALDFVEISLLTESLGLEPLFKSQAINIIIWSIVRFEKNNFTLFETYLNKLIARTKYDIDKNKLSTDEKNDLYANIAYSLWKSCIDCNYLLRVHVNATNYVIKDLLKITSELLKNNTCSEAKDELFHFMNIELLLSLDDDCLDKNIYDFINLQEFICHRSDNITDIFESRRLYKLIDAYALDNRILIHYTISKIINKNDNTGKDDLAKNVLKIIFKAGINNINKYFSLLDNRLEIELNLSVFKSYSEIILTLESQCDFNPFFYLKKDTFKYVNALRYLLNLKPKINSIFYEPNNLKQFKGIIQVIDLSSTYLLHKKFIDWKTPNLKSFIYDYFIPYFERHGIGFNDNPEYMAIIRKRIKDIKEPELDF